MNKGLLLGIDFTESCCRACYFNEKHAVVENVIEPAGSGGLLIPSVLCYDNEKKQWLIGEAAENYACETGAYLYTGLLTNTLAQESCAFEDRTMPYSSLFSIFFAGLTDLARRCSGVSPIACVNITLRRINLEIKEVLENAFARIGLGREKLHFLSYPESFAYFIIQQDESLWLEGADLFDFSDDGFFLNRLTLSREREKSTIFVSEQNYSLEFSAKDLRNIVLRPGIDERLNSLYDEIKGQAGKTSVYFTGSGFEELWFSNTLKNISQTRRAFRGNNIYAKGACLEGLLRKEETLDKFTVVCRHKTKASISVEARYKGSAQTTVLLPAAENWYETGCSADFILDDAQTMDFIVTSLLSKEKTHIAFDLSSFPARPPKTTRVRVIIKYLNEYECEICVRDLGFGGLYPGSGLEVRKILNLEGYI